MSGHSKWANIKNRKGAQDKKRSEAFTRVAKNILTAIRLGGGNTSIEANSYLKTAIDKAKEVNMPKENIERLITRFEERKANLVAMLLEGYSLGGIPMIVDIETDNKNRTLGEIKLIFRDHRASLGEANSVSFQFKRVGEVELEEEINEERQLELIDDGVIDFESNKIICEVSDLNKLVNKVKEIGLKIVGSGIVYRPINPMEIKSEEEAEKLIDFIDSLEENDDVVGVYVGADL